MISPAEIKEVALKWWQLFLISYIKNEKFFPRQIDRIGKVKPNDITSKFETLQVEIENLYRNSKNTIGIGYLVKTTGKNFRRSGAHQLPVAVEFETLEDYLHYTGKKREWLKFQESYKLLVEAIPELENWAIANALLLCSVSTEWVGIIKVCKYFSETPRPNLYIRQLPIDLHTKFIEENSSLIQSLLDYVIPLHIRNSSQKKFAERYYLKYDEPLLIRIRLLDKNIATQNGIRDFSIHLSDFEKSEWICNNILIAENKMTFLTLPDIPMSIAIWSGGGFNVSYLKNIWWLKTKKIYYWGDIDEHGFQILHQIRSYYPQVQSVMMDIETFEAFIEYAVDGERSKAVNINMLTEDESKMYTFLKEKENRNRLEQEKIPQSHIDKILANLLT